MTVITLSRELGSRGDDVAVALAERLALRVAGREVINRAARAAGAPEIALGEIDELGLLGVRPSAAALAQYDSKVVEVIRELADEDNIILVGRGAQVVLANRANVLHVRIIAPADERIATVQQRCGISKDAAAARVAASDRARAAFLKRSYRISGEDPLLYDLLLNTARLGVASCVAAVCAALDAKGVPIEAEPGDCAA
jgi:CMP/dCMP kinase